MSDFRDELDRMAMDVHQSDEALERTQNRAAHHQRTRRMATGLVGLAITAGSVAFALAAFEPGGQSRPAGDGAPPGSEQPRIWPQGTDEDLDAMQQELDEGRDTWRRDDLEAVGRAFAVEEMGWDPDDVETIAREELLFVRIWNPSLSSEIGASSPIETVLFLERWRGGDDGILLVSRAQSDLFEVTRPQPGEPAPADGTVGFAGTLSPVARQLDLTLGLRSKEATKLSATHHHPLLPDGSERVTGTFAGDRVLGLYFLLNPAEEMRAGTLTDRDPIALTAFSLSPAQESAPPTPEETPVPGPTPTSDDATPPPIEITVANLSGVDHMTPYADSWIQAMGRGIHHGGYEIVAAAPTPESNTVDVSQIAFDAGYESEAARMQKLLFPGAELVRIDDSGPPLHVVIGRDFAKTHREEIAAFRIVEEFGEARRRGSGAEPFLTEEAAQCYHDDAETTLYGGYASGPGVEVDITDRGGVPQDQGDTGIELHLHFSNDQGAWTELVRVDKVGSEMKVVEAVLSAIFLK